MAKKGAKLCPKCGKQVDLWCAGGSVMVPLPKPAGTSVIESDYQKLYHKACYDLDFERGKRKKIKRRK